MRLTIDVTLWRHDRKMEEALREIMARHTIGSRIPFEQQDHETYDIAISALPKWRQKFVKVRRRG